MTNIENSFEKILKNPGKYYDSPESVVEDNRFDTRQKSKILESWELDQKRLLIAEGENMTKDASPISAAETLQEIVKSQIALK